MISYPATPFVYETEVVKVPPPVGGGDELVLRLPGVGTKAVLLPAEKNMRAYSIFKASKEAFRDIAYAVFGEDWRWFEASMNTRDRNRMMMAIGWKIVEAID